MSTDKGALMIDACRNFHSAIGLDDDVEAVVGQFYNLNDAGEYGMGEDVVYLGMFHHCVNLSGNDKIFAKTLFFYPSHKGAAAGARYGYRCNDAWEQHHIAKGKDREDFVDFVFKDCAEVSFKVCDKTKGILGYLVVLGHNNGFRGNLM